jgi:Stress responsive A/B Barrel Domain
LPEIREPKKEMTRSPRNNRSHFGVVALLLSCFFLPGCGTTPALSPSVTQVILLWLKHPDRQSDRAQLVRTAHSLRMIPGVRQVETGRTVPALPPGVDRSFDLAVVVTFRDRAALQRYRKDPRHLEIVRHYLRPLVRRYEVYNLSGD